MMLDQPPRPDPPSAEPIERHPPSTAHSRINDSSPPSKAPSTKDLYVDQDARPVSSVLASLRIGATPQTFLTRTQSALPSLPVSPQSDEGVPQTPLQQQKGYAQPQQKSVFMKTPSMVAEPRHLLRPPPSPTVMENRKTKTLDPLPGRRMMSVLDFNRMVQTPRAGESRSLPPLSRLSTRPRPPPEWVRESRMSLLPPTPPPPPTHPPGEPLLKKTPVIGKIPKGLSSAEGYFRVFTEMKTVETVDVAKNGHHLATLLPHRYTKKMPLYGTSPRMMMMMQQRPPSRLAKLVATPTLRQSITMSRRPSMAPAATKRAARRLPKLANNAEPDATVAATETTVTAVEERPSAKTKRAPRKRINKAKLGAVKTPMPQKDGLAEREGNAAAMKTSGDAEGLEGLMEGKKNEESVAAASIEERTDPTDPTPWSQSPSQPIEPLTPPQHASLLPPPAAPLSSPTTTTTTLSQPPPTADYVPYKPRRPTPPNHVATDLSLLNRTEDSAEGEREDASDTLGGLPGQQPAAPATPTQKSKFAGRNHHASNAGFNPEEDVKKRRASFVPGLKKHGQAPVCIW
ncbi:hypothetical protein DFJ77DRAFT_479559 [Powellomyces hirtus]|nr:hypothetical protein DFJ77DRAFT_479559 [Powellomyces hirtus]